MLKNLRNGTALWLGTGAAILSAVASGCGGGGGTSSRAALGAAATNSSTTGGVTSGGAIGGGGTIGGGRPGTGGGGIGGIGSGTTPGGGGTTPGGGGTTPGGGGTTIPGGPNPPAGTTDDHGNNAATATVLPTTGAMLEGLTQFAGDQDWFKVSLSPGVDYLFTTSDLRVGMDTVVKLLGPTGTLIQENDNVAPPALESQCSIAGSAIPAAGTYYVVVFHKNTAATTGAFKINATIGTPTPPPPPDDHGNDYLTTTSILTLGTAMAGEFETAGDLDVMKVTLAAGQAYNFKTQNLVTSPNAVEDMDTVLVLRDAQGVEITRNDDVVGGAAGDLSSSIDYTPTAAGTYFLEVYHFWDDLGTYELLAAASTPTTPPVDDHKNDRTTTSILTPGATINGNIETIGDRDWFKIDLIQGNKYVFQTTQNGATVTDTYISLFGATGTAAIATDDDSGAGTLSRIPTDTAATPSSAFTAPSTGTFYLEVRHYGATATPARGTGAYTVGATMTTGTTPPVTPPVTPPSTTQATIASINFADKDASQDVTAGDELTVRFSEPVSIIQPAIFPPPALMTADHFTLPVAGDSFGAMSTWTISTVNSSDVVIKLGAGAKMRLTGTFNATKLTAGSSSAAAVKSGSTIMTASSGRAAIAGTNVDIATTLTTGFKDAQSLVKARGGHTATLLDDGRVLVSGGISSVSSMGQPTFIAVGAQSEIFDPVTGTWLGTEDASLGTTNGGYMLFPLTGGAANAGYPIGRAFHTATKLPNGKVFIAGGWGFEQGQVNGTALTVTGGDLFSTFEFDPATNTFAPSGVLKFRRRNHYATLLPNGQVMIAGGYNALINNGKGGSLPLVELYDPATKAHTDLTTAVANYMTAPRQGGSVELLNGKAFFIGGEAFGVNAAGAVVQYVNLGTETYDDVTKLATAGPTLVATDRRWHSSAKLPNGDIVVVGGDGAVNGAFTAFKSTEKLVAGATAFTAWGNLQTERARHQMAFVGNDLVVIGGSKINRTAAPATLADVPTGELIDVASGVTESYQMRMSRAGHSVVTMPSGKIMVVGGWSGATQYTNGMDGTAVPACEIFVRP